MASDNGLGSLLQFLPSFISLMHGMNNSGQKNTAAQLSNVNNAMINPNNPLYQQMYGQYRKQGQEQLGENISQMQGQNRMESAMGRTPLFAPERQGEQAFRAQGAMGPQIGVQAQQQTEGALQQAARSLGGFGGQTGAYNTLATSQYGPRAGTGAANQTLMGLGGLGNFLNGGQQNNVQRPMQNTPQQPNSILGLLSGAFGSGLNAPGASQGGGGYF